MKYEILNDKGKAIARFEFEHDRELCFDLLDEDGDLQKFDAE